MRRSAEMPDSGILNKLLKLLIKTMQTERILQASFSLWGTPKTTSAICATHA
jgi:hypothetical protein